MPFMQRAWFVDHSPGVGIQITSIPPVPPPPPAPIVDTVYSVAVGGIESKATASYTTDGVTWTSNTISSGVWVSVAWNGTVFCAVGAELGFLGGDGKIATSPNGITWTVRTGPAGTGGWTKIRWNGTVFCAISYPGNVSATSTDGITWTPGTPPTIFDPVVGSSLGYCLEWNGSVWCALSVSGFPNTTSGWATSTDGLTWTVGSIGINLPANNGIGAVWAWLAWNGSFFCAVAGQQDTTHISATSPDGQAWTEHDLPITTTWRSIAWNSAANFFCTIGEDTGSGAQVATSTDGVAWTSRTSPSLSAIDAVIFDGQYLLMTLNNHNSWLSADGITWVIGTDYSAGLLASNDFAHR